MYIKITTESGKKNKQNNKNNHLNMIHFDIDSTFKQKILQLLTLFHAHSHFPTEPLADDSRSKRNPEEKEEEERERGREREKENNLSENRLLAREE